MREDVIRALLARHELFRDLPSTAMGELIKSCEVLIVERGAHLLTENEPADCAFFVLLGRFVVSVSDARGRREVGAALPGELLGEMGLIAKATRVAAVHASRRSLVLRVPRARFDALLADNPQVTVAVSRLLARRLSEANQRLLGHCDQMVLAIVGGGQPRVESFVRDLADAVRRSGRTVLHVPLGSVEHSPDALENAEVALVWTDDPDRWSGASSVADRTWLVATSEVAARAAPPPDPWELVLVHRRGAQPSGTAAVLAALGRPPFHHIVDGSDDDHDRLVRHLISRPVVLALSGGAARGMVHLGVYRALLRAGIPIDAVAGTSAGSMVAGGVAQRWSVERVTETIRRHTRRSPLDLTFPFVALTSGRRVTEGLHSSFGDVEIEDCWVPFRAIATNLTTLTVDIPRTGPIWRAVRASIAIPGIFPPLVEPHGVMVDGGLLDNLPVGPLRAEFANAIVVSSLAVGPEARENTTLVGSTGVVGPIDALRCLRRRGHRARDDGVLRTLVRLTALGSAATGGQRGDIHLDHDASRWGSFDWKAIDQIAGAGELTALAALASGRFDLLTSGAAHSSAHDGVGAARLHR